MAVVAVANVGLWWMCGHGGWGGRDGCSGRNVAVVVVPMA